ncbi:MAG: folate-binding protein YgfZ [Gammaproteobacteria bacterium]|nr:folate-binding protein YgfZ [Gammaproteobacteria bacterium]
MNAGPSLIALPDWSVLSVAGADAERFLQGQITSDLRRLSATQALLAAWCEPDGRVLFTFLVVRRDADHLLLLCPCGRGAALAKQLGKYVLRAAVRFEVTAHWTVSGRTDTEVEAQVPRFGVVNKADGFAVTLDQGRRWLAVHSGSVASDDDNAEATSAWHLADVLAGLPFVPEGLAGEFLPQMLNLDLLNELSFDKGCFRGQEVIARLHHRGRVKRRLELFEADLPHTPQVGERLYRADAPSGHTAGTVFAAVPLAPDRQAILAVVLLDAAAPLLLGPAGPALRRLPLPYTP